MDHVGTEALLFQTGYLTITGEERLGGKALYRLGYPNREVRQSLNEHLLSHLVQDVECQTANSMRLARMLAAHDCAGMEELFHAFFASIPYEWYTNNDIANYEGFYASVFYSYFAALGYEIAVEESSSHGRLDMAVRTGGHVLYVRIQGGGAVAAGLGARPVAGAGLRREIPRARRAHPPDRRGVQPPDAQRDRVRGSRRLTRDDEHMESLSRQRSHHVVGCEQSVDGSGGLRGSTQPAARDDAFALRHGNSLSNRSQTAIHCAQVEPPASVRPLALTEEQRPAVKRQRDHVDIGLIGAVRGPGGRDAMGRVESRKPRHGSPTEILPTGREETLTVALPPVYGLAHDPCASDDSYGSTNPK